MIRVSQNYLPAYPVVRKPIGFSGNINSRDIKMALAILGVFGVFSLVGADSDKRKFDVQA